MFGVLIKESCSYGIFPFVGLIFYTIYEYENT